MLLLKSYSTATVSYAKGIRGSDFFDGYKKTPLAFRNCRLEMELVPCYVTIKWVFYDLFEHLLKE
ncbi:MAG: hypothetical protein ACJA0H_002327 [Francisellaceae bacterium]|jgi:hypothetical protein